MTELNETTVKRLIQEQLPPGIQSAPDVPPLLQRCLREYIKALAQHANVHTTAEKKTTISTAHTTRALDEMGFGHFHQCVGGGSTSEAVLQQPEPGRKKKKLGKGAASQMSDEELLRLQQELFATARSAMSKRTEDGPQERERADARASSPSDQVQSAGAVVHKRFGRAKREAARAAARRTPSLSSRIPKIPYGKPPRGIRRSRPFISHR